MSSVDDRDPYAEGADAYIAGRPDSSNPYEPATDDYLSWNDGWNLVAERESEEYEVRP